MAPAKKPAKKSPTKAKAKKPAAPPAAKKSAPKRAASKSAPKKKATPRAAPARPAPQRAAAPAPQPAPEPEPAPEFVKSTSAAERKAALEALLQKEGVQAVFPTVQNPTVPKPAPSYVRERSAQERKAAVEQLVEDSGVAGALSKAPWKRKSADAPAAPAPPRPAPSPAPAAPGATPDAAAAAPPRTSPRVQMTKAPLEATQTKSAPRVVILDANALMMQFQFHVDIEREVRRILDINFDIVVPSLVIGELERIVKEGGQKEAGEARMALELAKTFRVEPSSNDGDTGILRMAEQLNAIVVTNDKTLRARLRAKGVPNIYMRSRAFLTLEGHLPGV